MLIVLRLYYVWYFYYLKFHNISTQQVAYFRCKVFIKSIRYFWEYAYVLVRYEAW